MSKKLLSLFLAVVMLALAIPAAVLPAFAAEEETPAATVSETFSTQTDFVAKTLFTGKNGTTNVYDDTAYFIRWYESATSETYYTKAADIIPETAVAKINPALIEKGIVSADDTFDVAFNKWVAYVQEASSVSFTKPNWTVGSLNAAGAFEAIHSIGYPSSKTAFNLKVRNNNQTLDSEWDGNHYYITKTHNDNLYKGMYNILSRVLSASTLVKNIAIARDSVKDIASTCGAAYSGSALAFVGSGYFRLQPGTKPEGDAYGTRFSAVQWTSTYTGYATINMDIVHRHSGANVNFAVFHNGTRVTEFTEVTDAATANAAIEGLEIAVFPGDTIELAFARTSVNPSISVKATINVDTSRKPPEAWTGSVFNATENILKDGTERFFRWYDNGVQMADGVAIPATAVCKVNPQLYEAGIIDEDDTVKEAFDKWAVYLKENSQIVYNGAWEIDNVSGTTLTPVNYYDYYNNRSPFLTDGTKTASCNDAYWVVESGFDRVMNGLWNCMARSMTGNEIVSEVALPLAGLYTSVVSPAAYETGGMMKAGFALYTGSDPKGGRELAYTWTSHGAGVAKLTALAYSALAYDGGYANRFNVLLNGNALLSDYVEVDSSNAASVENFKSILAGLEIPVFEGDKVSIVFARVGGIGNRAITASFMASGVAP